MYGNLKWLFYIRDFGYLYQHSSENNMHLALCYMYVVSMIYLVSHFLPENNCQYA